MSYTPAGITLLVDAVRKRERERRIDLLTDMRAAMAPDGKAFEKLQHYLRNPQDL